MIGDAVNVAARLTELAKARPERVLADDATIAAAGTSAEGWAKVSSVRLRGREAETPLYAPT